jgi:pSer/pThr/pTyr-binding forkhead associated (FHA) protein
MAVFLGQLVNGVVVSKFFLDKQKHTIGRNPNNDLMVDDSSVSSHHAVIEAREDSYLDGHFNFFIKDLGSTNGTLVNDLEIKGERRLVNYDMVKIASHLFRFIDEEEAQSGSGTTMEFADE